MYVDEIFPCKTHCSAFTLLPVVEKVRLDICLRGLPSCMLCGGTVWWYRLLCSRQTRSVCLIIGKLRPFVCLSSHRCRLVRAKLHNSETTPRMFLNLKAPPLGRPVYFCLWYWVYEQFFLTSTHRYNAVRGHRTGSNSSGAEKENYLRRKTNKNRT